MDMVIDFTVGGWQFDDNTEFIDEPGGSRRRVDRENGTFTASSDTDFNVCIRVYDSNWRDRSNPAAGGWAMCDTCEVRYNDWARWDYSRRKSGAVCVYWGRVLHDTVCQSVSAPHCAHARAQASLRASPLLHEAAKSTK